MGHSFDKAAAIPCEGERGLDACEKAHKDQAFCGSTELACCDNISPSCAIVTGLERWWAEALKDKLEQLKQAEKEAEEALEAARSEAAHLLSEAENSAREILAEAESDGEREAAEVVGNAAERAEEEASKVQGQADAECVRVGSAVDKRLDDVVDHLLGKLIP